MNPKCLSEEEVDIGNSMDDNECRLIECESLSANSLRDVNLLHSKYEEIKAQLPGINFKHSNYSHYKYSTLK
jgi:hypothetical protein